MQAASLPCKRQLSKAPVQQAPDAGLRTPPCTATQLDFSLDDENGRLNTTSQGGTFAVLRNIGAAPCSLLPKPQFAFSDLAQHRFDLTWRAPVGMHPGPVMLPIVLAPNMPFTAQLQWVSGPVNDTMQCVDLASISLAVEGGHLSSSLPGRLCGPVGQPLVYDLQSFHAEPGYTPSHIPARTR